MITQKGDAACRALTEVRPRRPQIPCQLHVTHSSHFTTGERAHCSYNRAERHKTFRQQRTAIKASQGCASGKGRLRRKTNKVLPVASCKCVMCQCVNGKFDACLPYGEWISLLRRSRSENTGPHR